MFIKCQNYAEMLMKKELILYKQDYLILFLGISPGICIGDKLPFSRAV